MTDEFQTQLHQFIELIEKSDPGVFDSIDEIYFTLANDFWAKGQYNPDTEKYDGFFWNGRLDFYKWRKDVKKTTVETWIAGGSSKLVWSRKNLVKPIQTPNKPPFVDKTVFADLEYVVYIRTFNNDPDTVYHESQNKFQKAISCRLREWPTCCGLSVSLNSTAFIEDSRAILTPEMTCSVCGKKVQKT